MAKTVAGMLPFAVLLAGIAVAIWWTLSREMVVGRWLLAGFLVAHGLIHLLFLVPQRAVEGSTEWPFDMGQSWLIGQAGLDAATVRLAGAALIGVVALALILAGLATAGIVVPAAWWPALTVCGAVASALLLALCFSPSLVLGVAIDAILVWMVLGSIWRPAAT